VPGQLSDRVDIGRGLDLVAADRARIEHAEEPRLVQLTEKRLGDAPATLDLVAAGGDRAGEIAGPRYGAHQVQIIHRASCGLAADAI
jgi:hypothetical protein